MSLLAHLNRTDCPHTRRVAFALAVLWVLALADLCLTMWAHIFTPFIELNPIAQIVLGFGFPALVSFKLTTTLIGSLIFWRQRKLVRCEAMLWGLVFVYVLLALRWSEYTHGAITSVTLAQ